MIKIASAVLLHTTAIGLRPIAPGSATTVAYDISGRGIVAAYEDVEKYQRFAPNLNVTRIVGSARYRIR
jgi:hypothetical protein